jgi:selenide,water dikinase
MIKLTQTVQKGGCAAKVAATELRRILANVQFPPQTSEVLVDGSHFDDAAVIQVSPDLATVHTIDFFTPIVDTPRVFGRIAAANALSDIYAMGGAPVSALAVLAFPLGTLENSVITEVLQGGCDVLREAQAALVGGHSIDDDTLKFGLSVYGHVHPQKVWSNAGAQAGDELLLTKPLGTGTYTAALKRGALSEDNAREVIESMGQINSVIPLLGSELAQQIHAATDVTGFGLAGHLMQMARASRLQAEIIFESLPVFPQALNLIEQGFLTKAHRTNEEYTRDHTHWSPALSQGGDIQKKIVFDPQTSGGLLLSVSAQSSEAVMNKLRQSFVNVKKIGRFTELQSQPPTDLQTLLKFE